jgi:hypothetical protein
MIFFPMQRELTEVFSPHVAIGERHSQANRQEIAYRASIVYRVGFSLLKYRTEDVPDDYPIEKREIGNGESVDHYDLPFHHAGTPELHFLSMRIEALISPMA